MNDDDDEPEYLLPCDLYLEWAHWTGYEPISDVLTGIGLLVEWRGSNEASLGLRIAEATAVHVPNVYSGIRPRGEPEKIRTIWAITVPREHIAQFLKQAADYVRRIELASPVATLASDENFNPPDHAPNAKLAGVLDDGCAFANSAFQRAGATRVIWLWNQNKTLSAGMPVVSTSGPSTALNFGYGRQFSGTMLDAIAQKAGGLQAPAYALAQLTGLRHAVSHGTHVMDLLAGPEDWDLSFVQFPQSGIDDPSGLWLKRYALDGMHYVIGCAGQNTRVIAINISWGPQTGPHDGHSILEIAIKQLVLEQNAKGRSLFVTLAAGNSYESSAHAQIPASAGGWVDWLVPPDGEAPAFLEAWWPASVKGADVRMTVKPPWGPDITIGLGKAHRAPDRSWWLKIKKVGTGFAALLVVHATDGLPIKGRNGMAGRWRVTLPATTQPTGDDIHLYVARADHNMGSRRRATDSRLTDPPLQDARFSPPALRYEEATASAIRKSGTLSGIATGRYSFTAAGWVARDGRPAPYSSSGPTRDNATSKPNFACVTDMSLERPGVRASAVRSGTKAVVTGTSMAAPQLGRKLMNGATGTTATNLPPTATADRIGAGELALDTEFVPKA